jgi:hypothetical protein
VHGSLMAQTQGLNGAGDFTRTTKRKGASALGKASDRFHCFLAMITSLFPSFKAKLATES